MRLKENNSSINLTADLKKNLEILFLFNLLGMHKVQQNMLACCDRL